MKYDVIVVGGGHAGCEASFACAKKGYKTALITINKKNIADMPCNPSIGGTAKGIIVREIDALGGLMGKVADRSHFQIKMLNGSKGCAVRSLRAQADKKIYPKVMLEYLTSLERLDIIENTIDDLIVNNNSVSGVITKDGNKIYSNIVILTTGTYLNSDILVGNNKESGGPHGEKNAKKLSGNLKKYGLDIFRLKTGTPPRINKDSIDFSKMQEEHGDNVYYTFSFDNPPLYKINEQQKCFLLYTNSKTHKIINDNLAKSSMYSGLVEGIGPRYCPSIEDKIVRFSDKERHQLFLEPESLFYDEWYLQGFSTSMPHDIQEQMVHSLSGLENAIISKYAYAIEYDAIDPLQMKLSLESKVINNLFTAGQINGTSGYEEAAAQGLIAGINATLKLEKKEPLILKRSEAYIGVLIDDLVTKGTKEPYRMLTSRAEFRLLLRHDNADLRLREYGYKVGLISKEQISRLEKKKDLINELIVYLKQTKIKEFPGIKQKLGSLGLSYNKSDIYSLLKIPKVMISWFDNDYLKSFEQSILEEVEILIKYEGYINKAKKDAKKLEQLESKKIPLNIDYHKINNLALEARQKLDEVRPITIAQASRISGVNPSDITILAIYLKRGFNDE